MCIAENLQVITDFTSFPAGKLTIMLIENLKEKTPRDSLYFQGPDFKDKDTEGPELQC